MRVTGSVGGMRSSLHHYSYRSLDDHVTRMTRYATLMASELHGEGRRVSLAGVLLRPAWRFVRGMVVKRGLLDGWRGLAFHLVEARYVREKYLRLLDAATRGRRQVRRTRCAAAGSYRLANAPAGGSGSRLRA